MRTYPNRKPSASGKKIFSPFTFHLQHQMVNNSTFENQNIDILITDNDVETMTIGISLLHLLKLVKVFIIH